MVRFFAVFVRLAALLGLVLVALFAYGRFTAAADAREDMNFLAQEMNWPAGTEVTASPSDSTWLTNLKDYACLSWAPCPVPPITARVPAGASPGSLLDPLTTEVLTSGTSPDGVYTWQGSVTVAEGRSVDVTMRFRPPVDGVRKVSVSQILPE